jgi:hypothetical protein
MRAAVLVLVGCTSGVPDPGTGGGDPHDGGPDARGGGPIWADAPLGDGGMVDCKPRVSPAPTNGHHFPGQDCQGGCHAHGFTLSGSVYTSPNNNTSYSGATVTIRMANNQTLELVAATNGNFYTSQPIAYPVTVRVSSCPYGTPMVATVTSGACNAAGCHRQAGSAQIHLP